MLHKSASLPDFTLIYPAGGGVNYRPIRRKREILARRRPRHGFFDWYGRNVVASADASPAS
ncbi:MAG TPA: hypothetical protein VMP01_00425 [Pirellulaceae bacterium]|nr:hypothetical protein [Pirellulaceae bacterium]